MHRTYTADYITVSRDKTRTNKVPGVPSKGDGEHVQYHHQSEVALLTFLVLSCQTKHSQSSNIIMSIELGATRRSSRRGAKKRVYAVGDLVEIHDVSIVPSPFCCQTGSRANPGESSERNRGNLISVTSLVLRLQYLTFQLFRHPSGPCPHSENLSENDGSCLPRTPRQ